MIDTYMKICNFIQIASFRLLNYGHVELIFEDFNLLLVNYVFRNIGHFV